MTTLDARRVSYSIAGKRLVDRVDLETKPAEVLAIVGPNGAGKSTLLRLLAGDVAPSSGEVRLDGRPLSAFRPHELALRRAVLPQQTVLQFAFTVAQVVEMGRSPHRRGLHNQMKHDRTIVGQAMGQTEILELAERTFPTLSGGEQTRTTLARVLTQDAQVLLLDEPTTSLDLRHQGLVMQLSRELVQAGRSVVVIVHDLNLAAAHADRVALMADGRLVACGPPDITLTEELLTALYGCPLAVLRHPLRNCPLVVARA